MVRTRPAGCLVWAALGAIAGPASADFTCPGNTVDLMAAPPAVVMGQPERHDASLRLFGAAGVAGAVDASGAAPGLDQISFRFEPAGAHRLAHLPPAPRDAGLVNVTFSPGLVPQARRGEMLVAPADRTGPLLPPGEVVLARAPGVLAAFATIRAAEPEEQEPRHELDPATLAASVVGIAAAAAMIAVAILKLPR